MPIPTPNEGESQDAFISRCMGNDTMVEEYPDNEQRSAVCYSSYRRSKEEEVKRLTTKRGFLSFIKRIFKF